MTRMRAATSCQKAHDLTAKKEQQPVEQRPSYCSCSISRLRRAQHLAAQQVTQLVRRSTAAIAAISANGICHSGMTVILVSVTVSPLIAGTFCISVAVKGILLRSALASSVEARKILALISVSGVVDCSRRPAAGFAL